MPSLVINGFTSNMLWWHMLRHDPTSMSCGFWPNVTDTCQNNCSSNLQQPGCSVATVTMRANMIQTTFFALFYRINESEINLPKTPTSSRRNRTMYYQHWMNEHILYYVLSLLCLEYCNWLIHLDNYKKYKVLTKRQISWWIDGIYYQSSEICPMLVKVIWHKDKRNKI